MFPNQLLQEYIAWYIFFEYYKFEIEDSKILNQLNLTKKNYILVSCHRQENVGEIKNLEKDIESLKDQKEKNLDKLKKPLEKYKAGKFNSKKYDIDSCQAKDKRTFDFCGKKLI